MDFKSDNEISREIIGAAIEVHKHLGPGLLESAYESLLESAYEISLERELTLRGVKVKRQVLLPLAYKGIEIDYGYRLDLLVEDKIIVELKSVESITDVHISQILTYLRLSKLNLGLLINFNVKLLKNGIRRIKI